MEPIENIEHVDSTSVRTIHDKRTICPKCGETVRMIVLVPAYVSIEYVPILCREQPCHYPGGDDLIQQLPNIDYSKDGPFICSAGCGFKTDNRDDFHANANWYANCEGELYNTWAKAAQSNIDRASHRAECDNFGQAGFPVVEFYQTGMKYRKDYMGYFTWSLNRKDREDN
jgi:hypothetical protein